MEELFSHYMEAIAILLFAIGFSILLFNKNLIKKIMGLNIMDSGMYLLLASIGYIDGLKAPIGGASESADASLFVNPIPAGLVLTGIVVSVSVTAIMLALTIRLYARYHTLNLDEIFEKIHKNEDKGE
ncbi:MAG: cation:proton antiporter subunit C [Bacilli bacterium]|nr:cation:proton antiporter subunit C [Bacillales bacterium]MDY2575453.1 cation:proton antiporter subunit C [Bacilli bacterium]